MQLEPLLAPVGGEDPCGPNLKGSLEFAQLASLAQGKPERWVGEKLVAAAEDPDWNAVAGAARALLGKSKDLRVAVPLVRALFQTEGWAGLAAGLALVRALLVDFWDGVHPRLDPDDGHDPTLRVNSLGELGADGLLALVRARPLVSAARAGRFALRDVGLGNGAGKTADPALLAAAFAEADLDQLRATAAALHTAHSEVVAIESLLTEKIGANHAAVLGRLSKLLGEADALLVDRLTARAPSSNGANGHSAPMPIQINTGQIRGRDDVVAALDAICGYYRTQEPSSPIPILLERARGLVAKSFAEIVADLTPEGLAQLKVLRGDRGDGQG